MKGKEDLERIATIVVDAVYVIHRALGPGLLESAYQACLAHELKKRGLEVRCEVRLPVRYDDIEVDAGYRVDILVEQAIILETKAVQALAPVHTAQLLTYLRLSGLKLGFLINWHVPLIKQGIKRIVNNL
jgi:GxxExxY protein